MSTATIVKATNLRAYVHYYVDENNEMIAIAAYREFPTELQVAENEWVSGIRRKVPAGVVLFD